MYPNTVALIVARPYISRATDQSLSKPRDVGSAYQLCIHACCSFLRQGLSLISSISGVEGLPQLCCVFVVSLAVVVCIFITSSSTDWRYSCLGAPYIALCNTVWLFLFREGFQWCRRVDPPHWWLQAAPPGCRKYRELEILHYTPRAALNLSGSSPQICRPIIQVYHSSFVHGCTFRCRR